ncbi:lipase (class 3) domain-containing protein [Trichoderma breve]|uniref:sn-1-specific diacylglycerol lipase n=1 Tax=Trichoderma breve TaxID=2034170 RepID=A0A9W9EER7_9HYPO|nr:lipase (class 3) domain-containing protein [Trichoderma breve]KAJ4865325.1 lipase (class 3) domain-containing protein [Trichoderma breve]
MATDAVAASKQAQYKQGPTLLPSPVAQAVSLAARSTSLAIRIGSVVSNASLDAARLTTLGGLELAQTVLERSLENLHYAVTQAVFWTSVSFRLTGTTISTASAGSQLLLSSLDQLFGSTDSSRAVASIITLVRREFENPATGLQGERVGVIDLTLALSTLAYLQRACRKTAQEERRRQSYEEIIWDVVVLEDGDRVDVDEKVFSEIRGGYNAQEKDDIPSSLPSSPWTGAEDDEAVVSRLKSQIIASLSPDTTVSVSNSVSSVQTITVDVHGPRLLSLPTPPGAEIVETKSITKGSHLSYSSSDQHDQSSASSYRVVYKIHRNKKGTSSFRGDEDYKDEAVEVITDNQSCSSEETLAPGTPTITIPDDPSPPASPTMLPSSAFALQSRPSSSTETKRRHKTQSHEFSKPTKSSSRKHNSDSAKAIASRSAVSSKEPIYLEDLEAMANQKRQRTPVHSSKSHDSHKKRKGEAVVSSRSSDKKTGLRHVLRGSGPSISTIWSKDSGSMEYISGQEKPKLHIKSPHRDSAKELRAGSPTSDLVPRSPTEHHSVYLAPPGHRRNRSYATSIYSVGTNDSQSSLMLSSYYQKSSYNTADALHALRQEGFVDGTFPEGHLLPNITRYMRFSSACYGSNFLRLTGVTNETPKLGVWDGVHNDVRHFVHHTESQSDNILLASFVDPNGGSDATGATGSGVPLVHYISLDHAAKAVVLACRGTLGFEDVLADLTCDYDRLVWRGKGYRVHKGIHASARRLLYGGDGRVLLTLKEALREFPDYGLVLCGHSLGAGVTSLLGIMLPPPNEALVNVKLSDIRPPSGRRIHVYAYGPPAVMSSSLRKITRGLITTVVHGNDLVPHLSLGLLHDFQGVALAFKHDENNTKSEIRQRIWNTLQDNVSERWYSYRSASKVASSGGVSDEERWMLPALENMRTSMKGKKLLPPGEVFTIETQRVLRRDAFLLLDEEHIGRPAQRIVLKYVKDVEGRFGELRFGTSMLTDHSPAKYEDALNKLRVGVSA